VKTARNPLTGERLELVDGVWKPVSERTRAERLPMEHWSVVPGQAWTAHYRRQLTADRQRGLEDPSPDPRHVEPPKYPD
jgi:hypothetical protein